jgi:flagellar motor switch protein FliN
MKSIDQEIQLFVEIWGVELSRAIEIFTAEKAQVSCRPEAPAGLDESAPKYLWWQHVFEADCLLTVWVGAQESAWVTLAGGEPDERCRHTYFDILRQTHDGVASTLAARTGKPLQYMAGAPKTPRKLEGCVFAVEIGFGLEGSVRPELLLCLKKTNLKTPKTSTEIRALEWQVRDSLKRSHEPLLGPLTDLELPLAVCFGRASLPIREILKITPGSLIELDRTAKDFVDLIVHGTVIARGELVSVKGNYGVRIKQIISRDDRAALRSGR